MHSTRRCPPWGAIRTILMIILTLATINVFIYAKYECTKVKKVNNTLSTTINEQADTIKKLEEDNANLNIEMSQLIEENEALKEERENLKQEKNELQAKIDDSKTTTQISKNDFKSYMPYTAITDRSSKQWVLQQSATTDQNGLRWIDGKPMVAVGAGWNISVGDSAIIVCDNGNSFEVIIGDIKDNVDTDSSNTTTFVNNCRCEFIVDYMSLNPIVKTTGNVSMLEKYNGYVIDIQRI